MARKRLLEESGEADFTLEEIEVNGIDVWAQSYDFTERFLTPWEDRITEKESLIGQRHRDIISDSTMLAICKTVEISKAGIDYDAGGPKKAILKAGFKQDAKDSPSEGQTPSRNIENWQISISVGGSGRTLPENEWAYKFLNGEGWMEKRVIQRHDMIGALKIFAEGEVGFSGTVWNLSGPPPVELVMGKINSGFWSGFKAETLLFMGVDLNENENYIGGTQYWDCTLKFGWKPRSWNQVWIPKIGKFTEIFNKDNEQQKLYETDSFTALNPIYW